MKEDPKQKALSAKLESGFSAKGESPESKAKSLQKSKQADTLEKVAAMRHDKAVKAAEEAQKLAKINMGATECLKQEAAAKKKGKMNKNIQEFTINEGPALTPGILKNKNSVPVHAQMVNDAEWLQDEMKALLKDVKLLNEDAIQVSKNVYDGE